MACNYCDAKFCLLRIEKRCPSCGFSYCPKCLDNTIFVKQLNAQKKVCVKCSQYGSSGEVHMIPPPEFYKKKQSQGKKPSEFKSCERQNVNVHNKNANKADENTPSTSNDHKKLNNHGSNRAAISGPSRNRHFSDDWSDDSDDDDDDDDDLEGFAEGLELERESQRIADQIYRKENPHLYDKSLLIKIDNTKSTDEILRDAIKQLQTGLWDKVDVNRKRPPKCTLCSTKALVNCKGCESRFCMRCFDLHSDQVCNEYETLEPHEEN